MLFERIQRMCIDNDIGVSILCEKITGSRGNLPTWKKNHVRSDYLDKIADYFNVTVDYLLGKTDNPHPPNSENIHVSDKALKFALWGREDVTDKQLERIKKFAKIIEDEDE